MLMNNIPKPLKKRIDVSSYMRNPVFFKMKNGLKVLLSENHKFPLVKITLELDHIPFLEYEKSGIQKVFGQMLKSGTKNYSKKELDYIMDYMGTSFSTSFSEISVYTLKKYLDESISILNDIIINCTFNNYEEFEKIINQKLIDIDISEKDSNTILKRVRNVLYFGKNHPYGEYETADTIKNITLNDLKELYNKYYIPNRFFVSFVGDISKEEVDYLCLTYFSKWKYKKYSDPSINKINPFSLKKSICMVDVPALTQSSICIGKPIFFRKKDPLYLAAILANGVFGDGAQSRLFLNIREKKAYTYSIFSSLISDKNVGYLSIETQVRNKVTKSTVEEILKEINEIKTNKVFSEELEIKKKEIIGQFILDLEDPDRINDLFICALRNDISFDFYKNYVENIKSVTKKDIYDICQKIYNLDDINILIVGRTDEILSSVKKLDYSIYHFDKFGNLLNKNA